MTGTMRISLKKWTIFVAFSAAMLAGLALAQSTTKGGDLVIAMNGDSEPASMDGQIDPYDSTGSSTHFRQTILCG